MKAAIATASLVCMLPVAAAAQEAAAAAQNSGPMIVQQTHSTFLIAPDYKFTRVDHHDASLAGLYGGVEFDQGPFVGAGGYWQANGNSGRNLSYGGFIVGWMSPADRPVGFSVRSLVGWGEARLTDTYTTVNPYGPGFPYFDNRFDIPCTTNRNGPGCVPVPLRPITYNAVFHQSFFVAEPQADVLFRVASWGRLDAGVGYRAIGDAYHNESRLRAATATISFQVGNF